MDILLIGVGLIIFALFHHVLPHAYQGDLRVVARPTHKANILKTLDQSNTSEQGGDGEEAALTPKATPDPNAVQAQGTGGTETALPESTLDPMDWRVKFADKFTNGEVVQDDTSYRSADVSIDIVKHDDHGAIYYVADVYIGSIDNLKVGLAANKIGQGLRDSTYNIAKANNAILAISGDFYGTRPKGPVIRNGRVYRETRFRDVCVLYYDGTMETYASDEFDGEQAIADGAYQVWSFGPMLLKDGQPMDKFDSDVNPANPRSAIGYYEPGHYCFVTVDGRNKESNGFSLKQLSRLFADLGCTAAYNFDGGQTATMVFDKRVYNEPADGGRDVSDIVFVGELE